MLLSALESINNPTLTTVCTKSRQKASGRLFALFPLFSLKVESLHSCPGEHKWHSALFPWQDICCFQLASLLSPLKCASCSLAALWQLSQRLYFILWWVLSRVIGEAVKLFCVESSGTIIGMWAWYVCLNSLKPHGLTCIVFFFSFLWGGNKSSHPKV